MPVEHTEGGYAYLPSLGFASAGVVSLPGSTIVRAAFAGPVALEAGFELLEQHLVRAGRPIAALCGVEVRMPAVLPWPEFEDFNQRYLAPLERWGLLRDGAPPLTRTNVVPGPHVPAGGAVAAFTYTAPGGDEAGPGFTISGTPEIPAGGAYPADVLLPGDTSEAALRRKTVCAVDAVATRIGELGTVWDASCDVHLYTRFPVIEGLGREAIEQGLGVRPAHGVIWHDVDPPVPLLELEVDVRRYGRQLLLAGAG
jgi:hypothetical protein